MSSKRTTFAEPPRNERLFHLLRRVREGDILIPRFQRPFVWTDEMRLLLMDSIRRQMPIGSLVVWRTLDNELQCFDQIAGVSIAADPALLRGRVKTYVLDGHQRLTTLYGALADGLVADEEGSVNEIEETMVAIQPGDERPTRLVYDLQSEEFKRVPTRGTLGPTVVPLSILFNRFRLREFEHQHLYRHPDAPRLINRLGEVLDAFKDYEVPIITLATEDQKLATDAFTRLNTSGMALDRVGLASAAVWTDGVDLKAEIDTILDRLSDIGWKELEPKMVLASVKIALGLDSYSDDLTGIRDRLRDDSIGVFEQTAENLLRAGQLLRVAGIHGPGVLPYSYQMVLLADALGWAPHPPPSEVVERLKRWLWSTTYAETFAGINSTQLRQALEHLREVVAHSETPVLGEDQPTIVPITRFDFRSARSRAMAILMAAELQPRKADGSKLDALQLLAERGNEMVSFLFTGSGGSPDSEQRRSPENRILCLPTEANKIRQMLTMDLETCDPDIRRSHGIHDEVVAAWRHGGPAQMLRARRVRLVALERAKVESLGLSYASEPVD